MSLLKKHCSKIGKKSSFLLGLEAASQVEGDSDWVVCGVNIKMTKN